MKDWSYREAMQLAERKFAACIATHQLVPDLSGGRRCSCGWGGSSLHDWREHVDTACIVKQVKENRGVG